MGEVLDALKHFCLLCVRREGQPNSEILYISMFLYTNALIVVKQKILKFINKTDRYNEVKLFFETSL